MCSCLRKREKAVSPGLSSGEDTETSSSSSDSLPSRGTPAVRDMDRSRDTWSPTASSDQVRSLRKKTAAYRTSIEFEYRKTLPSKMFDRSQVSFWSILRNSIGKELSRITMPIILNEPLSFIQRLCEYMEYGNILQTAAKCTDPVDRMELVCAFVVSAMSSNYERLGKPFNPVLGETYECVRRDMGFQFVGEQVSHHPPVTAFHAEGFDFKFYGTVQPKLKFWGKTVDVTPKGKLFIEFQKLKETYSWENPGLIIHNVIVGNLWFEYKGDLEVRVNNNRYKGLLHFTPQPWLKDQMHHVQGFVYDGRTKKRAMYGSWVKGMYSCAMADYEAFQSNSSLKEKHKAKEQSNVARLGYCTFNFDIPGQKTLWAATPRPRDAAKYYSFSHFSMGLNEMLPKMELYLPRTDSRNRTDIRAMENGDIDKASEEKERIEVKQREARKADKKSGKEYAPRWFRQEAGQNIDDQWLFTGNYWVRDWKLCRDLFGDTSPI